MTRDSRWRKPPFYTIRVSAPLFVVLLILLVILGFLALRAEKKPSRSEATKIASLGHTRLALGYYEEAVEQFRRALQSDGLPGPARMEIRLDLALALLKSERPRQSFDELIPLLIEHPYERRAYLLLGQSLGRFGLSELAFSIFAVATEFSPGDAEERLAEEYGAQGNVELAARFRALAFARRGQYAEGEQALRQAADLSSPGVLVYLSEYLVEALNIPKARHVLEELAARIGSDHPDVLGWRAMALAKEGRPQEAASLLGKLMAGSPRAAPIWAPRLAVILLEDLDLPKEAVRWLWLAAQSYRGINTTSLLTRALFEAGDSDVAFQLLDSIPQEALAVSVSHGDILHQRLRILLRCDLEKAGRALAALTSSKSHVPEYHLAVADWLEAGGDAAILGEEKISRDILISRSRRQAARLADLEEECLEMQRRAARNADSIIAAEHLCDVAEKRNDMGDRREAIRYARLAAYRSPAASRPLKLLALWFDRPGEIFLRSHAECRLARLHPDGPPALETIALVRHWLGEKAERIDSQIDGRHAPLRQARKPVSSIFTPDVAVRFVDITGRSGVDFKNVSGSAEKNYILEVNGGGVALFDFDLDGRLDIFLVNGSRLPPPHGEGVGPSPPSDRLYRNLGDLRFEDVTDRAGLAESAWGCGVAAADYDNDGDPDLFVTNHGPDRLWRNNGDGTFTDVTGDAGVGDPRWGSSCAFLDFDGDGWLDLFVANYLAFDPTITRRRGTDPNCQYHGIPIACGPSGLPPTPCTLYRNLGNGWFRDISESSGIREVDLEHAAYSLGIAVLDYDADGRLDIYVANDTRRNLLFRNLGEGRFRELGMATGVALNDNGMAQAGMGVDAVFLEDRDVEDLFVVNFADDGNTYYRNSGRGYFTEVTAEVGLLESSFRPLGWGTFFFDADLDGHLDLFVANGHIAPQADEVSSSLGYRQLNTFFLGDGRGGFADVSSRAGPGLTVKKSSRGAACGDLDGDGDADIVINDIDERVTILENAGKPKAHWLAVKLQGTRSNRDGIGAVVTVAAGEHFQRRRIGSGSSYASQGEVIARFGLGPRQEVRELRVRWPSGLEETFPVPRIDRVLKVIEEQGTAAPP